jgi:hypothetical protein
VDSEQITAAVLGVTGKWAKQRKAEERNRNHVSRRREAMTRSRRLTVKDAAWAVMKQAYLKASTNSRYPAHARQIMYAARGPIQEATGETLGDKYFTQTLLPDYLAEHPDETAAWDVVFDARGHFTEPHTERVVPLGTLDVRKYLRDTEAGPDEVAAQLRKRDFPTSGPQHRFGAVLFIEKEGFMPLFKAAKLAERFDIAIMSTKGMSVTASRQLVDHLCWEHKIPLLVLHDFDKSGFAICGTLQRDTRRYAFENEIEVIDLGLRLADVEGWGLEYEAVFYEKSNPTWNLARNGATKEEIAVLCEGRAPWGGYQGRRVELNAFSSGDFLQWIEGKLRQAGAKKVVPDAVVLGPVR